MRSTIAACFVSHSASSTMSNLTYYFSLAHSKLRSAARESGSRDDLSLRRWVLLKNSITTQDVRDVHSDSTPSSSPQSYYCSPNSDLKAESNSTADNDPDVDYDDEEVDSDIDEGMFAYLFPDPGDAVAAIPGEGFTSEEQWFDSIFETLQDDDDEDEDNYNGGMSLGGVQVHIVPIDAGEEGTSNEQPTYSRSDPESNSLSSSYSDEYISSSASSSSPPSVSYSVAYPPKFNRPFDVDSHDFCCALHSPSLSSSSRSYLPPYSHTTSLYTTTATTFERSDTDAGVLDDVEDSIPDAIEDTSDDDESSEAQSLSTPFSRSRSSLSLVIDPASIPLPRDRFEPQIYSASDDYFCYKTAAYNSESNPVYSLYHQSY